MLHWKQLWKVGENIGQGRISIKLEEINKLVQNKDYKGAMNIVDSIDWRRVKNVRTLCVVGRNICSQWKI